MTGTIQPQCCVCQHVSREIAYAHRESNEVMRGLVYVGHGKWLCAVCTRTAVGAFARVANTGRKTDADREEPPPGFA